MLLNQHIVRNAVAALALTACLRAYPATVETSPDADRIQKLEQAVQQLQNEIKTLKAERAAFTAAAPAEGPTKKKVTYDGKTYIEKEVPAEKSAADKWKLSTPITELELFGDIRLRYEYRGGQTNDSSPLAAVAPGVAGRDDWQERDRWRYRLRLGLRGTVLDDWFFGLRLETSTKTRSGNVTFGDDTSGSSDAASNGPFSKTNDGINVGQAYVGYKGFKDITLTGGRMPNPLITTRMTWDPDINPEGAAEQWKHTFKFGGSSGTATEGYSKDGKNVAAAPPSEPITLDLFVNFAQFIYDDANPENPLGPRPTTTANGTRQLIPNTDAYLLAWQLGGKVTLPNSLYFQLAPTLYNYTGNGDTFNVHFQGGDPFLTNAQSLAQNQTGINSLLVFDMPGEVGWKLIGLPMRVFGDFAVNFEGDDRASAAGHPDKGDQRYSYQIGLGVGQLKKKHDWEIDVYWQRTDQFSLDPNLVDDDLFDARTGLKGIVAQAGYMLSDAVSVNLTYSHGWVADDSLGTGGNGGAIGINPIDHYNLFQADLMLHW